MSAAVVRLVGLGHLDLAEDVVHDALVQALEVWKFRGVPSNPAAWLMAAAKNRAIDVIRRERTARRFAPEVADQLSTEWSLVPTVASAFEDKEIVDAELRLMFELCDGRLPEETQVMVVLKYLCGFGVRELAQAFLSGEEAIEQAARARARDACRPPAASATSATRRGCGRGRTGGLPRALPDVQRGVPRQPSRRRSCARTSAPRRCGWPRCWPTHPVTGVAARSRRCWR